MSEEMKSPAGRQLRGAQWFHLQRNVLSRFRCSGLNSLRLGFRDRHLQPLGHLSEVVFTRVCAIGASGLRPRL